MIRLQRNHLKQTFSALQWKDQSEKTSAGLAASQREIADQTREFADALAARLGEPVELLENAVTAMGLASISHKSRFTEAALDNEEVALAELVQARQNLKQILKQSESQSGECRQIDKQQRQAMKPPKPQRKDKAPEALAKLRSEIEKLAQAERDAAQQAREMLNNSQGQPQPSECSSEKPSSGSQGGESESKPSSDSSPKPASLADLAERQRQAALEADRLAQQLQSQPNVGPLSKQRLDEAASSIRESQAAAQQGQAEQTAEQADEAASKLDRLSEHLAAAGAADFEQRLSAAQRMAERLAASQGDTAKKVAAQANEPSENETNSPGSVSGEKEQLAKEQGGLADRGEELSELMAGLQVASLEQEAPVRTEISELDAAHSSHEAADMMRQAEQDLRVNRPAPASQSGRRAAETLGALAEGLRSIQDSRQRADLEKLTAAERKTAEAIEALSEAKSEGERALAQTKVNAAQEATSPLAARDSALAEALQAAEAAQQRPQENQGLGQADRVRVEGLRQVGQVLQRRIQEAILQGALSDPDDSVPADYRQMVEEYYRTLSEDLR